MRTYQNAKVHLFTSSKKYTQTKFKNYAPCGHSKDTPNKPAQAEQNITCLNCLKYIKKELK